MTKSQLRQLEDLKFEIEKAKLELELQSIRSQLTQSKPKLDVPSFVRQQSVSSVSTTDSGYSEDEVIKAQQRIKEYNDFIDSKVKELNESSKVLSELKQQKKSTKDKSERETLSTLIDEGVKRNVQIQHELSIAKSARRDAYKIVGNPNF